MGRLTKKKIDQIRKLRKQDYTQKEVAENVGVHVRTVRKYDPYRVDAKHRVRENNDTESIRSTILVILQWLDVLNISLLNYGNISYFCPRCCENDLEFDADEEIYFCSECGYKIVLPRAICRCCFTVNKLKIDKNSGFWICQECGAQYDL